MGGVHLPSLNADELCQQFTCVHATEVLHINDGSGLLTMVVSMKINSGVHDNSVSIVAASNSNVHVPQFHISLGAIIKEDNIINLLLSPAKVKYICLRCKTDINTTCLGTCSDIDSCLSSPANSRFRQLLYRLVASKYYRIFITVVILFHSFTFVVPVRHPHN